MASPAPEASAAAAAAAPAVGGAGAGAAAAGDGPKEKKPTAKELRILERERAAAAKAAASAAANASVFGEKPLIASQEITGREWTSVGELTPALVGKKVLVRARVHASRETGKVLFLTLRQAIDTAQAVVVKADNADLFKWVAALPKESFVDVTGTVTAAEKPVLSVSNGAVELAVESVFLISKSSPVLPFQLEDAARPDHVIASREAEITAALVEGKAAPAPFPIVTSDTRLDYRWIDLRTPANNAIMRISSGVCALFREFLAARGFTEIQSPKLLAGASEGGSAVFKLSYFGQDACLAQSPQLFKQMAAACSDLERVFEIGPVFRAENSNTHRHLCEFHGLDLEMAIHEHYYEALDLFSDLFIHIFTGLKERYGRELEAVRAQHPFEDLKFHSPSLRITYKEGLALLKTHAGIDIPFGDDLSTAQEKALGAIVRERYGTDFFIMDQYPSCLRPFYTMPDPEHPEISNSYDMFLRGEEIVSGAQRVHDPELLVKRIESFGIPVAQLQSYVDSFKHGALPHAGGGIGLERVVMLFLGLPNIRKAALFTRDPRRLAP